jgi:hypothetical protein
MRTATLLLAAIMIAGAAPTTALAGIGSPDGGTCFPGTCTPNGGSRARNVAKMCKASNCKHAGQTSNSAKRRRSKKR